MKSKIKLLSLLLALVVPMTMAGDAFAQTSKQFQRNPDDDGIGMQGTLIQPPPSNAPTISLPSNGQVFRDIPITVSGLCEDGLLVIVYKNNVMGGAVDCSGGSYQMKIDIFGGLNDLYARQYDGLDQGSPESNHVSVTYFIDTPVVPGSPNDVTQRITLTTPAARRGADPGTEMQWPITLTGGVGPYAVSVNWGDGNEDLLTRDSTGTFELSHAYDRPGVYRIIIKATDANDNSAFLQVIGIGNGEISDITTAGTNSDQNGGTVRTVVIWQPALILFPLLISSFWLGKRYQLRRVRYRIKNHIVPVDK